MTRLAIWCYASGRPHLLYDLVDQRVRWLGVVVVILPAAIAIVAILIADQRPRVSLVLYGALSLVYFLSIPAVRTTAPPESAEQDVT